jgi:hypothetical protein
MSTSGFGVSNPASFQVIVEKTQSKLLIINHLKKQIMKTILSIYPLIFTSGDFMNLDETIGNIKSISYNKILAINSICGNVTHEIAKAALDLEECIENQNKRGYRYNSYLLTSALLKLTFAYEVIKKKEVLALKTEEIKLATSIKAIELIIFSNWKTNEIEIFQK